MISTGVSLQADRRCANGRRRLHITLELPWSADKALQQCGRSHRSNQSSAPIFRILISACGGERRFASSAAKRLQTLGALLKGDRRALGPGADLKAFDIDNIHGHQALDRVYTDMTGLTPPMPGVAPPMGSGENYQAPQQGQQAGHCFKMFRKSLSAVGLQLREGGGIPPEMRRRVDRFLNRILGLGLREQQMLFAYFTSVYDATVASSKSGGTFEDGIVSLQAESITVQPGYPQTIHTDRFSGGVTQVLHLTVLRGLSFDNAAAKLEEGLERAGGIGVGGGGVVRNIEDDSASGFYVSTFQMSSGRWCCWR
jgi:hypothetical protein